MALERDYRAEANAARKEAREKLIAFREARRRSRAPAANTPRSLADVSVDTSSIAPDTLFNMSATATDSEQEPEPDSDVTEEISGQSGDETSSDPEASLDDLQGESVEAGDTEKVTGDDNDGRDADTTSELTEVDGEPASDPSPEEPAGLLGPAHAESPADTAVVPSNTDLFRLPGAGAGMVWMFQRCGIHSLSDLAQADARELSIQLGIVGHILNIKPWIEFAEEAQK